MEEYLNCKLRLFSEYMKPNGRRIFNDEVVSHYVDVSSFPKIESYGQKRESDWHLQLHRENLDACHFSLSHKKLGTTSLNAPLVGGFIIENLVGVLALFYEQWVGKDIAVACSQIKTVPGRLERVDSDIKQGIVFVDYAHTPDALDTCLQTLRPLVSGSLILVFGCGGDRDKGKRPMMAQVAETFADKVIVTSDNPRTEKPESIVADILDGASESVRSSWIVELDRARAIERSIKFASEGDCVLIAGKGHETYQIVGVRSSEFDDRAQARKYLDQK